MGRMLRYVAALLAGAVLLYVLMRISYPGNPVGARIAVSESNLKLAWRELDEGGWNDLSVTDSKKVLERVKAEFLGKDRLTGRPYVVSALLRDGGQLPMGIRVYSAKDAVPIIWTEFSDLAGGRVMLMSNGFVVFAKEQQEH